jgi:quercetin dioxygenase-like cupin family protein
MTAFRSHLSLRSRVLRFAVLLGAVAAGVVLYWSMGDGGQATTAHAEHGQPHLDVLARSSFPDQVSGHFLMRLHGSHPTRVVHLNNASDVVVIKVTIPPGGFINWHTHPGPGTVAVAEGTLTITYAHDCTARDYDKGQAFLDPGSMVHRADNNGATDVIAYVTFLGIPPGPATIPVPGDFC